MTKNQRPGPRKPAAKFPNLQKKMTKQMTPVNRPSAKKDARFKKSGGR